ncbi:MarR family transcriptional regulator [Saccharopolyspora sp. K220]|uniref:GbsR/MarR family transcriptional regulator n=1 Tax=Saccharopolyspora soli TaxID=2926618 RepID=UPI001F5A5DB2|nr:helix-turn-helix domain-containing protein [Saccharopolyspora soli]MCI2422456.1 MarR family transcriptional regulator [Saccharopolyspora soli]
MSPDEAEFVDRIGLFMETVGGPRTMGRIYGWLMICDPPQQSLTELAAELGASKASISTMIRPMQEGGLVERLPSSTRQHQYRIAPGGFTHLLQVQLVRMGAGVEAAEFGLSVIGDDRPQQRERLEDLRDFCRFTATDARDEMMQRWTDYRAANRSDR